jgi:hypothetical protein
MKTPACPCRTIAFDSERLIEMSAMCASHPARHMTLSVKKKAVDLDRSAAHGSQNPAPTHVCRLLPCAPLSLGGPPVHHQIVHVDIYHAVRVVVIDRVSNRSLSACQSGHEFESAHVTLHFRTLQDSEGRCLRQRSVTDHSILGAPPARLVNI